MGKLKEFIKKEIIDLSYAKIGDKFLTRNNEIVTFIEHYHVANHKLIQRQNGETYLVTDNGVSLNSKNDIIKKLYVKEY